MCCLPYLTYWILLSTRPYLSTCHCFYIKSNSIIKLTFGYWLKQFVLWVPMQKSNGMLQIIPNDCIARQLWIDTLFLLTIFNACFVTGYEGMLPNIYWYTLCMVKEWIIYEDSIIFNVTHFASILQHFNKKNIGWHIHYFQGNASLTS